MAKANPTLPVLSDQDIQRFWNYVDIRFPGECWDWRGSIDALGYGYISIKGRNIKAHRIAYLLHYDQDPSVLLVCHKCDRRRCCNPLHLFTGTHADNTADMMSKGRHARCGPKNPARGDRNGSCKYPERLHRGDQNPSRRRPDRLARGDRNGMRLHPQRVPRGERHGNAKLTAEQVRTIRRWYGHDGWTLCNLAEHFHVSKSLISYVVRRETWQHITE